jgi:hypothetical protein
LEGRDFSTVSLESQTRSQTLPVSQQLMYCIAVGTWCMNNRRQLAMRQIPSHDVPPLLVPLVLVSGEQVVHMQLQETMEEP